MRKTMRKISFTLILCLLFTCMTGCSLFVDKDTAGEGITQVTITLNDGEKSTQHIAKYGEKVRIDVIGKDGYYLDGYFDAEEGGTKYFDGTGQSLQNWNKDFPTTFYARWIDIAELKCTFHIFGNEPEHGGSSGQRTANIELDEAFVSALQGNTDRKLKIVYSIDLKTGIGYEEASPIEMYIKGYDNSGAERYTVFTHTPLVGEFSTFTGSVEISANDFATGNMFITVRNTKAFAGSWAYPTFYSRNLTVTVSFAK